MKHILRKPMLPLILLAILVFGTAFLSFFRSDIDAGWRYVDDLYQNTQIEVELVSDGGGYLQMPTHKDIIFSGMPEVLETYTLIQCPYVLRDGTPLPTDDEKDSKAPQRNMIHGTNNIGWFTEYWQMNVAWESGYGKENFRVMDGVIPCLVKQELLDTANLQTGDTVYISPTNYDYAIIDNAPQFEMLIVGTYTEPIGRTGGLDMIAPEECFMGEPKLLYGPDLLTHCFYRAYALKINPDYNREYDRIEDELDGFLYDLDGFSFVTNADALEKAARPLIQKLQMQELLVTPLCLLLCAAAVIVAVLLGMGMNLEVFLRLMWGEKRVLVFMSLGGVVFLLLALSVILAWGCSILTAGSEWALWGVKYASVAAGVSLAGFAVPLMRACTSNLIKSYQSREAE